jgi:circadian clock protein KaiB
MSEPPHSDSSDAFEKALRDSQTSKYLLRLYITGNTDKSSRAILNLREVCEKHLEGRYQLEVIDINQQPALARHDQIIATPTLVKQLPLPIRRLIGDLSETERILVGLDLVEVKK